MLTPWVSARAYSLLLNERDRLRGQVDRLLDHTQVLERVAVGLSEKVPVTKPADPIPLPILRLLRNFGTPLIREMERSAVIQRRADGEEWEEIHADMMQRFYGPDYQPEASE
jgi:hypothetical protein